MAIALEAGLLRGKDWPGAVNCLMPHAECMEYLGFNVLRVGFSPRTLTAGEEQAGDSLDRAARLQETCCVRSSGDLELKVSGAPDTNSLTL